FCRSDTAIAVHIHNAIPGDVRHRSHPASHLAMVVRRRSGLLPCRGARETCHPFITLTAKRSNNGGGGKGLRLKWENISTSNIKVAERFGCVGERASVLECGGLRRFLLRLRVRSLRRGRRVPHKAAEGRVHSRTLARNSTTFCALDVGCW